MPDRDIKGKAVALFEYIGEVYGIDLPVFRNVLDYGAERWWQADFIPCRSCRVKSFDVEKSGPETATMPEAEDGWLSVYKTALDKPPSLPAKLLEWVELSSNPTKRPTPKPIIIKRISFNADERRVEDFREYLQEWKKWVEKKEGESPPLPEKCEGWVERSEDHEQVPQSVAEREIEEKFEEDPERPILLETYINNQWVLWEKRSLPAFKANALYDQLFALHQRLSVEGDRWEIFWGHLLLNWRNPSGINIFHPLILTPVTLEFHSQSRNITLVPSPTQATRLELDCLRDLEYAHKDTLLELVRQVNSAELPPNPWSNNEMRGLAGTVTGYLSSKSSSETNLYLDEPIRNPSPSFDPTIHNAPIIFVRERVRHFWIEDAQKVAAVIADTGKVPPFLRSAISPQENESSGVLTWSDVSSKPSSRTHRMPLNEIDLENSSEEPELYFPLEFNDQQKEIWEKLTRQFGVLVQGPPGTGKSHTIANIICDALARGQRVLVTSQTENALKVLRKYMPEAVRSLCVAQLGNDTESKKQLNEAVTAIGKHLVDKGSKARVKRIHELLRELRICRENQAKLYHQIQEWVQLDSQKLYLGEEEITAHEAAKECADKEKNHGWMPDRLEPSQDPPLSKMELRELCSLLREIPSEDRNFCLQGLPNLEELHNPVDVSRALVGLRSAMSRSDEIEELGLEWGESLASSPALKLQNLTESLEAALVALKEIQEIWQIQLLDLMSSSQDQLSFWRDFLNSCRALRDQAFDAFKRKQGFEITGLTNLDNKHDWLEALAELSQTIEQGRNPANRLTRFRLSKNAKHLFDSVAVDSKTLSSLERIEVVRAAFIYESCLKKFEFFWNQNMPFIHGPTGNPDVRMPLADIDSRFKKAERVLFWIDSHNQKNIKLLIELGCPHSKTKIWQEKTLTDNLQLIHGILAQKEKGSILDSLNEYCSRLKNESGHNSSRNVFLKTMAKAIEERSAEKYETFYKEIQRLHKLHPSVQRLESLLQRLRNVAPLWAEHIEREGTRIGVEAIPQDWMDAWRWQRLHQWLVILHSRESVEELQVNLEMEREKEREFLLQLVAERTWQRQIERIEDSHYMALTAWATAMKNFGRGTGTHAPRYLAAAAKAMIGAVNAVPAWIMPQFRVVQAFPAEAEIFDLIIVDEASQCDIRSLPILFRAKKVIIVGDPEQISPTNVGVKREKVFELMRQRLGDIPHPERFAIDNSLFAITQTIPGLTRTMLTEHFRCVPAIIEFNNHLCPTYGGNLEPLRQPDPKDRLDPPIVTCFIPNGYKNDGGINKPEAEALVEAILFCLRCERYKGKTFGVISLLGEPQAKYISEILAKELDETEREERNIICGDAYAFQGDERDVMFLSLVVAPPPKSFTSLVKDDARQRFNVATSRARDQVFLFHSVQLSDITNEQCMRYKLLKWYLNPPSMEIEASLESLRKKTDSPFEYEVGERIIKRGYKVIPQFKPFPKDFQYRIDFLVQGKKGNVAVECDGDRWHGPERWEYDQRREAQLRRAGLKFYRINGSAYYRNKEKALELLWPFLQTNCG